MTHEEELQILEASVELYGLMYKLESVGKLGIPMLGREDVVALRVAVGRLNDVMGRTMAQTAKVWLKQQELAASNHD